MVNELELLVHNTINTEENTVVYKAINGATNTSCLSRLKIGLLHRISGIQTLGYHLMENNSHGLIQPVFKLGQIKSNNVTE